MTTQTHIIQYLNENPGVSTEALAAECSIPLDFMQDQLQQLEAADYVKRQDGGWVLAHPPMLQAGSRPLR